MVDDSRRHQFINTNAFLPPAFDNTRPSSSAVLFLSISYFLLSILDISFPFWVFSLRLLSGVVETRDLPLSLL